MAGSFVASSSLANPPAISAGLAATAACETKDTVSAFQEGSQPKMAGLGGTQKDAIVPGESAEVGRRNNEGV